MKKLCKNMPPDWCPSCARIAGLDSALYEELKAMPKEQVIERCLNASVTFGSWWEYGREGFLKIFEREDWLEWAHMYLGRCFEVYEHEYDDSEIQSLVK
jgi:hypothetical protein